MKSHRKSYYTPITVFKRPIWNVLLSYGLGLAVFLLVLWYYLGQLDEGINKFTTRSAVIILGVGVVLGAIRIVLELSSKKKRKLLFEISAYDDPENS